MEGNDIKYPETDKRVEELVLFRKAGEIQAYADGDQMNEFYNAIKSIAGLTLSLLVTLRTENVGTLLKDKAQILNR